MAAPDRQRWLWVTPAVTDHRSTGALVYSLSLVDAVAEAGVDVTCIGLGSTATAARSESIYVAVDAPVRPSWQRLFSAYPNQTAATSVRPFRTLVDDLLRQNWDAVVVDGMQAAWVTPRLAGERRGCVVYLAHNHETSMRAEIARATRWSSVRRPLLELDARKTARLELETLRRSDVVSSISIEDLERFRQDAPEARHVLVRPGWAGLNEPGPAIEMSRRPRRVGILGSFEWHPKQEGLRRFLMVADPLFAGGDVELVVAGQVPADFRRSLEDELRATRFLGWVENPADVLAECRVGAIAEPLGGGFKLKALDYVFNDVVVATLAHSAAGLPFVAGSGMIVADDELSLADAIVGAIGHPEILQRMALEARSVATDEFSWSSSARVLIDAVAGAVPSEPAG